VYVFILLKRVSPPFVTPILTFVVTGIHTTHLGIGLVLAFLAFSIP